MVKKPRKFENQVTIDGSCMYHKNTHSKLSQDAKKPRITTFCVLGVHEGRRVNNGRRMYKFVFWLDRIYQLLMFECVLYDIL